MTSLKTSRCHILSCTKMLTIFSGLVFRLRYAWVFYLWKKNMPFACKNSLCSSRTFNNCSICHRTFFDKASLIQCSQQKRDTCERCERSSTEFKPNWYLNSAQNNPKDLHHAACTGNFQLVAEFMRTEFSDQPGKSHLSRSKLQYGYTPIHCAAFGGHYDCLKLMLSHPDGKPNIIDPEDGRTPVHLACWKGHADCLKLLLSKGGNLYLRDHNRDTPISLARDYACLSIILLHLAGKWIWDTVLCYWKLSLYWLNKC